MSTLHPCPGTGPGTVQYDACHAADQQTIANLRTQLAEASRMRLALWRERDELLSEVIALRAQLAVRTHDPPVLSPLRRLSRHARRRRLGLGLRLLRPDRAQIAARHSA